MSFLNVAHCANECIQKWFACYSWINTLSSSEKTHCSLNIMMFVLDVRWEYSISHVCFPGDLSIKGLLKSEKKISHLISHLYLPMLNKCKLHSHWGITLNFNFPLQCHREWLQTLLNILLNTSLTFHYCVYKALL